jgi:hypothetical protein
MAAENRRQEELGRLLQDGIESAVEVVGEIDGRLVDCSRRLRVGQDTESFQNLAAELSRLGDLFSLVREIRAGVGCLSPPPVPANAFASWESASGLFQEMMAALEGRDWVTLADLIQYELSPFLASGEKDLAGVRECLARA